MGRPKKPTPIYQKAGRPFRSDMELVINAQKGDEESYVELWDKFFLLRQKEKFSFINWCKKNKIDYSVYQDYVESWDADAWEKFRNQMKGIRINDLKAKGYNNDNWGISIRLKGYFEVVNRTYSNNIVKKLNNETSAIKFFGNNSDDESESYSAFDSISKNEDLLKSYAQKLMNSSYTRMISDLNNKQKKIVTLKSQNNTVSSITRELGVKRSEVNDTLKFAKTRLEYWVENTSKKDGIPMSYSDMVEYFR